jgi:hypothetical protein
MSILDIKGTDGAQYGAGFDAIYNAFAQYFLNHHNRLMQKQMRADFVTTFVPNQNDLLAFEQAARGLGLPYADQANLNASVDLAMTGSQKQNEATVCLTLYQLIRENTDKAEANTQILLARKTVSKKAAGT